MGQAGAGEARGEGAGAPPRLTIGEARRLLDGDAAVLGRTAGALGAAGAVVLDAIGSPLGRASLRLGHPLPPWTITLRWSPVSGLALIPAPEAAGRVDVVPAHAGALPSLVARLVGLDAEGAAGAPTATPPAPFAAPPTLPAEVLDAWLRGAPRSVLDAGVDDPATRGLLLELRDGLRGTWSLTSEVPDTGGRTVSRAVRIVDAGGVGLWQVTRLAAAGGVAVLSHATPGDVRALVAGVLATRPVAEVAA